MNITAEDLKKPAAWAVIVPAVALCLVVYAGWLMMGQRAEAERLADTAASVFEDTRAILVLRGEGGESENVALGQFEGLSSARRCAAAAAIPEARLFRGESGRAAPQNDGSLLHRETYRLNSVRLIQAVVFIDYAERTFSDLVCNTLALNKARTREADSWDLTASIQYLTR